MGRAPCCDRENVKKGPWCPEEDTKLKGYIEKYGTGGNWIALPQKAGLKRCGKSCRLRWLNYLRPNIKHGDFTNEEDRIICSIFATIGSRWSIIAAQLPGRTDNDVKNYWNTKLKKKLMTMAAAANPTQSQRKPPFPTESAFSSLYKDFTNSYFQKSLAGFDSISSVHHHQSSSLFNTANPSSFLHNPVYYSYLKENNNMLVFGSETSCSTSSDGSMSHIKQEDQHHQQHMGSRSTNFMLSYGSSGTEDLNQWNLNQKENGYNSENQVDYSIEDVKNLISSSGSNNGSSNFLFIDENKTDEKVLYYYNY